MADKQITPFQLTDQFTMDNFNQRINETNIALQSKPNPNLLDNWYFGNPVDQRQGRVAVPGVAYYDTWGGPSTGTTDTYYTAIHTPGGYDDQYQITVNGAVKYVPVSSCVRGYTGEGYGIDRWKIISADITFLINDDGSITIINTGTSEGYVVQEIGKIGIQAYCGSALFTEVVGVCGISLQKSGGDWDTPFSVDAKAGVVSAYGTPNSSTDNYRYIIRVSAGGKVTLKAVKLELGTTQTLAHQDADGNWVLNEIPNYGEQLARCQRYYYDSRFGRVNESDGAYSATLATSNAYLVGNYRFPVTMRVKPSITIYSYHGTANRVSYWISGADVDKPVEVNNLTVGASGFNAVQAATAFDPNTYAFHIVANAEL